MTGYYSNRIMLCALLKRQQQKQILQQRSSSVRKLCLHSIKSTNNCSQRNQPSKPSLLLQHRQTTLASLPSLSSMATPFGDHTNNKLYRNGGSSFSFSSSTSNNSKILSLDIIKSIQMDLKEVDVNHDNKIDFEELKMMLRKYPKVFDEEEVDKMGELFFIGRSGQSVSHTKFLRAIQFIVAEEKDDAHANDNDDGTKKSHPLKLESVDDKRCFISPTDKMDSFYNTQEDFDKNLAKYLHDVIVKKVEQEAQQQTKV